MKRNLMIILPRTSNYNPNSSLVGGAIERLVYGAFANEKDFKIIFPKKLKNTLIKKISTFKRVERLFGSLLKIIYLIKIIFLMFIRDDVILIENDLKILIFLSSINSLYIKNKKRKIYFRVHNKISISERNKLKKLVASDAVQVIAVSNYLKTYLNLERNIYLIENYVNSAYKYKNNDESSRFCRKNCMVYIGRFTSEKGCPELISAYKSFVDKGRPISLRMYVPEINEYDSKRLAAEGIELRINKSPTEIYSEICPNSLFVMPTKLSEGFNLSLAEAIQMGLRISSTECGANKELLENLEYFRLDHENLVNSIESAMTCYTFNKIPSNGPKYFMSCEEHRYALNRLLGVKY